MSQTRTRRLVFAHLWPEVICRVSWYYSLIDLTKWAWRIFFVWEKRQKKRRENIPTAWEKSERLLTALRIFFYRVVCNDGSRELEWKKRKIPFQRWLRQSQEVSAPVDGWMPQSKQRKVSCAHSRYSTHRWWNFLSFQWRSSGKTL